MDDKPEVSGTVIALCIGVTLGLLIAFSISPWLGTAGLLAVGLWPKKEKSNQTRGGLLSDY